MSSTGYYNKNYISTLDPMLDTREIKQEIVDIYREEGLTGINNLAGRKKPITTGQPVYYNWTAESLFKQVVIDSVTSGNGGTTQVLVLTAATSGYIKLTDMLKTVDNKSVYVYAVNTASGVDTVTTKSVDGSNISVTAADKLAIYTVAMGEKADAPPSERFGVTKKYNKYQIFEISDEITDVQQAATVEFTVNGSKRIASKSHYEKRIKLNGMINAAFVGGSMSNTSYADTNGFLTDPNIVTNGGGGGNVQTTRGFDKYIEQWGTTLNTGGGAYSQGSLDDALDNLIAMRSPMNQLVIGGKAARRKVSTFYKNMGSSGVNSVRLMVNGNEIDFNVDKVSHGDFVLNYSTMEILDHPIIFKQTPISKSLYFLPYDEQVKIYGGGSESAICTRYIPNQSNFGNDMIGEKYDGAFNPVNPTGLENTWKTAWTTKQGLEFLAPEWALRQQVL